MKIPNIIIEASRKLRKNMTYSEVLLWKFLKDNQIGVKVLRQKPIFVYKENNGLDRYIIADFYIPDHNLVVEIDGNIHDIPEILELDIYKQGLLCERGIHVIRFTNDDVLHNIDNVINKIKSSLRLKGSPEVRGDGMIK